MTKEEIQRGMLMFEGDDVRKIQETIINLMIDIIGHKDDIKFVVNDKEYSVQRVV